MAEADEKAEGEEGVDVEQGVEESCMKKGIGETCGQGAAGAEGEGVCGVGVEEGEEEDDGREEEGESGRREERMMLHIVLGER